MASGLRLVIHFGLVLALLVSAVPAGHALGQPRMSGLMVVCIGSEVVTVAVDANGQPIAPHAKCPECVLALVAPIAASPDPAVPWRLLSADLAPGVSVSARSAVAVECRARAPPRSI